MCSCNNKRDASIEKLREALSQALALTDPVVNHVRSMAYVDACIIYQAAKAALDYTAARPCVCLEK